MNFTPKKSSTSAPDQLLQTPKAVSSDRLSTGSNDDCNVLLETFSGMKINNASGALKRSADLMTVEGSPINVMKRMDSNPTPNAKSLVTAYSISSFAGVGELLNQTCDNNLKGDTTRTVVLADAQPKHPRKVYVISSGSDSHDTGNHQENALRTSLLCGADGCLRRHQLDDSLEWALEGDIKPASISDLIRVHEYEYLSHLERKCRDAANLTSGGLQAPSSSSQSPSPSQQHHDQDLQHMPPFYAPPGNLDVDTPLVAQSLDASRKFCGAAMMAVDRLMIGYNRSKGKEFSAGQPSCGAIISHAFVLGRPPGHHAGSRGCVPSKYYWKRPDMTSSGFCLLNTVAVAAAYARYRYGREHLTNHLETYPNSSKVENSQDPLRIAIVDIDVHHGNGTEEIIRNLRPRTTFLPLPSSWAPVTAHSYKPWLDETDPENVFFASINLFEEDRFYPCSGSDSEELVLPLPPSDVQLLQPPSLSSSSVGGSNIINIGLTPVGPGLELSAAASREMREKVASTLLPRLLSFRPDILFISAGFDAHYDDLYHFLDESDFHWLTEQLCSAVEPHGGKVISILEGGYSLSSPLPPPKKNLTARQSAMTVNADPTAVSTIAGPVIGNTAAPLTRRKGAKEVVINAPTVGKVVGGDATALTAASTALPSSSVQHSAPETSNAKANPVPVLPSGRLGKGKNKKYIDGTESITSSIPISRSGGSLKSEEGSLSTTTSQHILLQQEGGVEGRENPNGQDSQIKDINIASTRVPVILSYAAAASKNAMAGTDIQHKDNMAHLSSSNSKEGGRLTEAPSSSSSPLLLTAGLHSFQSDQGTAVGHLNRNIGSATASFVYSEDQDTMFAQERGDGGLVKGVLAHMAALAGHRAWIKLQPS